MNMYGMDHVYEKVIKHIAPSDSMYHGSEEYYFECGASALSSILAAIKAAGKSQDEIFSVLDYASGYGRVLRWLLAKFPSADALAVDVDLSALAAIESVLSVKTVAGDASMDRHLNKKFDLIWCGSLITHLPQSQSLKLLRYFNAHLAPGGVCVFSSHGPYVADRVQRGEKLYGLEQIQVDAMLSEYRHLGYGFGLYPNQSNYGISISKIENMKNLTVAAGLRPVFYEERAWVQHQDVIGAVAQG